MRLVATRTVEPGRGSHVQTAWINENEHQGLKENGLGFRDILYEAQAMHKQTFLGSEEAGPENPKPFTVLSALAVPGCKVRPEHSGGSRDVAAIRGEG